MNKHAQLPTIPIVVPHLILDVHTDGTLTARLDGAPLDPEDPAEAWRRESLPQIVDRASGGRTVPVRVEVHETDGRRFIDIIPPIHRPATPMPSPTTSHRGAADPACQSGQDLVEVSGDGFLPGEDVAVTVVVCSRSAGPDGVAHARIDPAHLACQTANETVEVVLFGRVSGTTQVETARR